MGTVNNPTGMQYNTYNDIISDFKFAFKQRNLYRLINDNDRWLVSRNLHQHLEKNISNVTRISTLKKIGESFTGYCIELWLWGNGYALNGLSGNSFTIEPQYAQGNHRIDFKVEISGNAKLICVIDAKNWARYSQKNAITYITKHIISFNSFSANYKLIFLNDKNIPHVKSILKSNNVKPIPIIHHITDKRFIKTPMMLDLCMKESIEHLDNTISIPDVSKDILKMTNAEVIKYDIELGKPYKLIKLKWSITQSYIDKLKSELIKSGVKLSKKNTKPFTRLKQYNDFI